MARRRAFGAGGRGYAREYAGCSMTRESREKGTCDNHLTIRRDEVETRVLTALQEKLVCQDLFEEFCDEFTREMNRLRMQHRASLSAAEREIERIEVRRKGDRDGDGRRGALSGQRRAERECGQAGTTGSQAR
jgi:hypothetical protein